LQGLDLVGDRDVGVQIWITRAAVSMGERGRDQAADVDLPHAVRPLPGVQYMVLNKAEGVSYRGLVRPLNHRGNLGIGDRPQRRH
jgi:hypothetical protein